MKFVAQYYGLKVSEIKSKRRTREISVPRQIAMYLCREHTKLSLPEIGKQFGGKDHTTVIFSHKKISKNIQTIQKSKNIQKYPKMSKNIKKNPKIYKATESFIEPKILKPLLIELKESIVSFDNKKILTLLSQHVEGFNR